MNKVKPALPKKLPVEVDVGKFATELAEASFELGKLDGLQRDLPNSSLLIAPLTTKEATVSSKIEGTRSTVSDVFLYEAIEQSKYDDTIEVVNYKKAMIWAMEELKRRKLNTYFIKELHSILLKQARGEKFRSKFRETQVFIGEKGATIEKATYIPPEAILVPEYMANLEEYLLNNKENPLIKSAIIHYQFEAIHPFQDGNGRIGRLLVPLYLYQEKLLYQPILFLSGYFDKHRNKYIEMLHLVDTEQKYEEWIKFFLISVKEQSKETQRLIYGIKNLINEVKMKTNPIKSLYIPRTIDFIFKKPVFSASELSKNINANRVTTLRLIKKLEDIKIISSFVPPKKKRKIFIFKELVNLLM
jgi:Fic family protein